MSSLPPLDLAKWCDDHAAPVIEKQSPQGGVARTRTKGVRRRKSSNLDARIDAYMATKDHAISGSGGHKEFFDIAVDLVQGWDLGVDGSRPRLQELNRKICEPQFSDAELEHKLREADELVDSQGRSRGWLRDAKKPDSHAGRKGSVSRAGAATHRGGTAPDSEYPMTDMGNAARFAYLHGHEVRYCPPDKCWYVYVDGKWTRDRSRIVPQMARDVVTMIVEEAEEWQRDLDERTEAKEKVDEEEQGQIDALHSWATFTQSAKAQRDLLQMAESEADIAITPEQFDAHDNLLNFKNGTLELHRDGVTFREHRADDLLTRMAASDYNPAASCPRFDRAILEIVGGDDDYCAYIDRVVGSSITGCPSEQNIYILEGGGRNGKNLLFDTYRGMLGDYGREADPELLMARKDRVHPTGVADLAGARFVTMSETEDEGRFAEALVKRLTGNKTQKARFCGKDFFEFSRSFTLILLTNHLPEIKGTDEGIWDRMKVLPFRVMFVDNVEDVAPPSKLLRDPDLGTALQGEYAGIMNRVIRGYLDWKRGGMQSPKVVREAVDRYRGRAAKLSEFIERFFISEHKNNINCRVETGELYALYQAWCQEEERTALSSRKFGREMRELGHELVPSNGKTYRSGLTYREQHNQRPPMTTQTQLKLATQ